MRELTSIEVEFVSGGSHLPEHSNDPTQLSAGSDSFTDGQCVAAGAGMGLAGGVGAIGTGMAVGSVVPGAGTLVGGLA